MKLFLSIIAYGFSALTPFYCFLLTQHGAEWVKISFLRNFIVQPPFGVYLAIFFGFVAVTSHILLYNFPTTPFFQDVRGANNEVLSKSSDHGFDAEFENAASEIKAAAKEYFMAGERDFAATQYEDAARNYDKSISKLETMSAYLNLCVSRYQLSNLADAKKAGEKGLAIAMKKGHQIFAGVFQSQLANIFKVQGELDQSLEYFQEAALIFETEKHMQNWASAIGGIATVYLDQGLIEAALTNINKSLKMHQDLKDIKNIGHDYLIIGNIYTTRNNLKEASAAYKKALSNFERKGTLTDQAIAIGNIGGIYKKEGNLSKALEFQERALKLFKKMNYRVGEANTIGNIGHIYSQQGRLKDAVKQHTEALKIQTNIGAKKEQVIQHINLALDFQKLGEDENAFFHYGQALELGRKIGVLPQVTTALINQGELYFRQGDVQNALKTQNEALDIATNLRNVELKKSALKNLEFIYSHMDNQKELVEVRRRLAEINTTDLVNPYGATQSLNSKNTVDPIQKNRTLTEKTMESSLPIKTYQPGTYVFKLEAGKSTDHWIHQPNRTKCSFFSNNGQFEVHYRGGQIVKAWEGDKHPNNDPIFKLYAKENTFIKIEITQMKEKSETLQE
jgi:tetratricopeptide (TPR) repeat protein